MADTTRNEFLDFAVGKGFDLIRTAHATGEKLSTLRAVSSGHRRLTDRLRAVLAGVWGCEAAEIPNPPAPGRRPRAERRGVDPSPGHGRRRRGAGH